jgi:hypothetical protein
MEDEQPKAEMACVTNVRELAQVIGQALFMGIMGVLGGVVVALSLIVAFLGEAPLHSAVIALLLLMMW